MPKHGCRAAYFADDKDLSDIFEQGKFSLERLKEYARSRGIFISQSLNKGEAITYLRRILCDLHQVRQLVETLDSEERAPHLIPERKPGTFSDADVKNSIERLKARHKELGLDAAESISLTQTAPSEYKLEISYSEHHWRNTRLLQNEPKVARIDILREDNQVRFRVEANSKARQIFNAIPLESSEGEKSENSSIDLSEIKTPKQRTALFIELIKSVYGHPLHDVTSVNVEYMKGTEDSPDPTEEESQEKKEEIRSMLQSVALSGTGLLFNKRYRDLIKSDYYLCKVAWTVDHDSKTGDRVALSAGFENPVNGKDFRFSVLGKWERNSEGELKKTRVRLAPDELRTMQTYVEQAAFEAYDYVVSSVQTTEENGEDEKEI